MKPTSSLIISSLLLVTSLTILSCSPLGSDQNEQGGQNNESSTAFTIEGLYQDEITPIKTLNSIEFIPLETNEGYLVAEISEILVIDSLFYIADSKSSQLLIFKQNGSFSAGVGSVGKGPGEYLSLDDIAFNADTTSLLILSNNSRKILEFSLSGDFISETPITVFAFDFTTDPSNNYYCFVNKNTSEGSLNYDLVKVSQNGDVLERYFEYDDIDDFAIDFSGFVKLGRDKEIIFNESFSDTIFSVQDGAIRPKYVIPANNPNANLTNREIVMENDYRFIGDTFFELSDWIIINFHKERKAKTVAIDLDELNSRSLLSFPLNSVIGVDRVDNIYASIFPSVKETAREKSFFTEAIDQYPELARVLDASSPNDNPILIKFSL